jgi:hypothetical protein
MKKEYFTGAIISYIIALIIFVNCMLVISNHMSDAWISKFTTIDARYGTISTLFVTSLFCFIPGLIYGWIASARSETKKIVLPSAISGLLFSLFIVVSVYFLLQYSAIYAERSYNMDIGQCPKFSDMPGLAIAQWILWGCWYIVGSLLMAWARKKFFSSAQKTESQEIEVEK